MSHISKDPFSISGDIDMSSQNTDKAGKKEASGQKPFTSSWLVQSTPRYKGKGKSRFLANRTWISMTYYDYP